MSTPPPAAGQQQQAPDPESQRIRTLDERFGAIEQTQADQGGKIDRLLAAVAGTAPAAPPAAQHVAEQRTERGTAAADTIGDAVRQAVRDVGAEQEQQRQQASDKAELERLRAAAQHPEHPPRERRSTWRARIQKGVFGITDGPPQR